MPHRKLKDIVTAQALVHAAPDETVSAVASRMQGKHVGAVLILQNGIVKGIFTGSNLIKKVLEPGLNPKEIEIGDIMTSDPICLDGDALGFDAVRAMRDNNIRHVVVRIVDGDEFQYGVVSARDFPTSEMAEFEDELEFELRLWEEL